MAQNLVLNILAKDKTKQAFAGVRAGLTNLRSAVFSVQSAIIGIGGGLAIKSILNVGSTVEQLRLRFAFLFKGVQEGDKAFQGLIDFASKVPFSLEEIQAGAGNLAVVTKNAEELKEILELTGNVASVTGLDFRTTAEQIQRSFSSGIGSADLFRERGVRALLGFKAGATVTVEETKKRFRELFGKGGEFEKATEVLSTTLAGTLSMLSDKLFKFRLETAQAGFFDFVKQGLVEVNKLIEDNSEVLASVGKSLSDGLIKATKEIIIGSAVIIQAIKPVFSFVFSSIGNLFDFLQTLPETIRTFGIIGFLMLGGKGKLLVLAIGGFLDEIRFKLGEFLQQFAEFNQKILETRRSLKLVSKEGFEKIQKQNEDLLAISERLRKPISDLKKELENTADATNVNIGNLRKFLDTLEAKALISKKQVEELLNKLKGSTEETKNLGVELTKIGEGVLDIIKKDFENINQTIAKGIVGGIKSLSKGIAESIVLGKDLENTMKQIAQRILIEVLATFIQFIIQQKILNKFKKDELTTNHNIERSLKRQIALQAVLMAMGGGGGGGLPFFHKGGAVSKGQPVIVGEKGPELFVPNQTGQITQNARGTSGGSTTVNFNITTVDARGFDELLVARRGTISRIINESVNERGREALI
mgnify:CR=1 FL=1|tara:strand:- start:5644 stop:7578 length:1935 start_codon:yes stop_codon:yes gene_type:complete